MNERPPIRDEFEVILIAVLAALAGFLFGAAGAAPAHNSLPTPPAEAGAENHPRADDRSASSARRGSYQSPYTGLINLPAGAASSGGRIESESVHAAIDRRTAAGRESNFQS